VTEVKLTKNELRSQQTRLGQLERYLPTLKLKKAMLQAEVNDARAEISRLEDAFGEAKGRVQGFSALLTERTSVRFEDVAKVAKVHKRYENIAGVEVPYFESVDFEAVDYSLYETPAWLDAAVELIRSMKSAQQEVYVAEEKKAALEKELREVSIRVNLFEKILIPRAQCNIKKIKVFLGDQELAAVGQAKVAKEKIEAKKLLKALERVEVA
jgi:V/A-type H+-transporting ATPase subunit D